MPGIVIPLFLFFLSYHQKSYAIDTMTVAESITDGDTLISAGGTFEMGFFSPGNSTNRYVGIWYSNVSVPTVVWVANRQFPLTNKSGVLHLVHNHNRTATLILVDGIDSNNTIWSSPSHMSKTLPLNPILQLLDSGNLVIRDENYKNAENFHWQSFDYPVDTLLPGMKLGKNFKTGFDTYLSSWKSFDDPSPGDYTYRFDPSGYPQLIMRKHSVISFRLGSWNGLAFSGIPSSRPSSKAEVTVGVVYNEIEVYYTFNLVSNSTFSKLSITPSGTAQRMSIVKQTESWRVLFAAPLDHCDDYSRCGAYSTCNLLCQCLDKFTPRNPKEWEVNDGSSGCVRVKSLECKSDGFRKYSGLKLPDTRLSLFDRNMKLEECEMKCSKNCSCMAYASLDILNGSGCLMWFGDLIDMKDLAINVQDIYVRMASSDSDHTVLKSNVDGKKEVMIKVLLPLIFGISFMVMSLVVCYWRKKKRAQTNVEGRLIKINETVNDDMELQLFSLQRIMNATKNFSIGCKLGEGGFGPVYKGILDEGQEIAVKRLSKTSKQGIGEFKNEVVCIAKLQHRNLVKLIGYCMEDDEMMLIYEYMPNNSLDSIIFDEKRRKLLDWPTRYRIINGIARGLLYLHQDSRLRIIHRDLKPSNVLLDNDMNPKISDFGLARIFGGNEMGSNTTMVVGTYGYMSPEYAVHGLFSVKSDVFSFGVLLLEIVSGKKNRGFSQKDHDDNLLGHTWRLYKEDRCIELIDEALLQAFPVLEVMRLIHIGLLCVQHSPQDRPNMSLVVLMLVGERSLSEPKQPSFFNEDNILQAQFSSSVATHSSVNEVSITLLEGRV